MYIDTEGSFMEERAKDIASSFVNHVHKMANLKEEDDIDEGTSNLSVSASLALYSFVTQFRSAHPIHFFACLPCCLEI